MNKDIKDWKVINNTLSDHNMIYTVVGLQNKYKHTYKDYKNTNWAVFYSKLEELLTREPIMDFPLTEQNTLDKYCEKLTNHIYTATEEATPTKTINRTTTIPWWTHQLTVEKQKTKKLKKVWRKNKLNNKNENDYKEQENKYKNLINKQT